MVHSDRDPITKPGLTGEDKRTRRNSGRFVVFLIGGVAVAAFCLYLGIVIWGVTGSN
jgi:hypothetical protein